nr:hypothetical protein CFP56_07827 [Quercus suber]
MTPRPPSTYQPKHTPAATPILLVREARKRNIRGEEKLPQRKKGVKRLPEPLGRDESSTRTVKDKDGIPGDALRCHSAFCLWTGSASRWNDHRGKGKERRAAEQGGVGLVAGSWCRSGAVATIERNCGETDSRKRGREGAEGSVCLARVGPYKCLAERGRRDEWKMYGGIVKTRTPNGKRQLMVMDGWMDGWMTRMIQVKRFAVSFSLLFQVDPAPACKSDSLPPPVRPRCARYNAK